MATDQRSVHLEEKVERRLAAGYAERCVREVLAGAGVNVGRSMQSDIRVNDKRFYARVLAQGSLGLGESYMKGWWDCDDLSDVIARLASRNLETKVAGSLRLTWGAILARLINLQSRKRAPIVGIDHYDRTLEAYKVMTGETETLSCGYWKDAETLQEAQHAKHDLICRKLGLTSAHRVLDIGCGFGSFAKFAAENYGCDITGINISPQQADEARRRCRGLPVNVVTCDYRDVDAYLVNRTFDRIVSVGMFEHVGYKNYRTYFEIANRCLNGQGQFLLHTIGSNVSLARNDPWFDKYIFPNGLLPSIRQIGEAIEGLFVMEDWHNFSYDYYATLMNWHDNFAESYSGDRNDVFFRMWTFYLLSAAGWFKARRAQLWQVVLSKGGTDGGYRSVR